MQMTVSSDGSEHVNYRYPGIPFYIQTSCLSNYDGYSAISHWHEDFEFMYIISGHMWYQVNEETVLLEEGEGIFTNAYQLHYGFSKDKTECQFLCLIFHPDFLSTNRSIEESYLAPVINDGAYPYVHLQTSVSWHRDILNVLAGSAQLEYSDDAALRMQLAALKIFIAIQEHLPKTDQKRILPDQNRLLLKLMIGYIHQHYAEKITLEQLSDHAGISKSQCRILFQRYTGKSPIEYVSEYRLQKTLPLLKNTDKTIVEIALESGFSGSSYYCELFKRTYGTSPMQFRKSGK